MTSYRKSNHFAMTEHNNKFLPWNAILHKKYHSSTCTKYSLISNSSLSHLIFTHMFQYSQWRAHVTPMCDKMKSN